ncbi:TetR/AcrR family transcriptional regulator [Pseudomonas panipatensis]|uniref:Transcriptional regulator, TetR family n=1 Tax=Pseudomonas panipatensis TaxID=428992 RepID=A0A1G8DWQ8_9PSED|nr:TetR/AcrR family transcriptional regulator [Pseudomonas panipatensis]SDH62162.1 transcriptional regulator, TetR family [Pseudomonas panipatensis]SMP39321.1 transcriptional regulator, TetR family [Pseudomonas panipatensis]
MTQSNLRHQQKQRTRQALLQAAAELIRQGGRPTLEEVAAQAMVSRATAYRYFPKIEGLYLEASIDVDTPQADQILAGAPAGNAVARLERVDDALHAMTRANEVALRMMLAQSLELSARGEADAVLPARQNRRSPLIDAALDPLGERFSPAALKTLKHALALVMGPEAMIVLKDVLRLDDAEARKVRRWAIRALVQAAQPKAK